MKGRKTQWEIEKTCQLFCQSIYLDLTVKTYYSLQISLLKLTGKIQFNDFRNGKTF